MVKVPAVYATYEAPSNERKIQIPGRLVQIISNEPPAIVIPGVLGMQTAVVCLWNKQSAGTRGVHVQIRDVDDDSGPGQGSH